MTQTPGDRERAFAEHYRRHYGAVLSYARRRTDEATARDVAAETFLTAWRRQDEVASQELPWLYRTAALVLRNHERAGRRQQRTAGRLAAQPVDLAPDPAVLHTEHEQVRAALLALSDDDRELLLLVAWEQLDTRSLAAFLGCSAGTAAVRLHRARRRLRQAIAEPERQPDTPHDQLRCSTGTSRKAT